jgi:heme/copper-type cytochrome/quinol oxidase subunit 4
MYSLTPLARVSIIVSWIAVGLACTSTVVHVVWLLRIKKERPRVPDFCVWIALVVGIVLVAQTTWAMVDEGSGRHQWDIEQQTVAAVAKASQRLVGNG